MDRLDNQTASQPELLLDLQERSSMALLRLIAAAGIAVAVLGLALGLGG